MSKDTLIIYEGAMCCSTGVCGPEPDKDLIEFNNTLKRLQKEYKGLEITRASISFDVKMFLENKEIFQLVQEQGQEILPIIIMNGRIIAKKKYLKFDEFEAALKKNTK